MNYILWAVLAMGTYGIMAVLLKVALKDMPFEVPLVIMNTILVVTGIVLVVVRGQSVVAHLSFSWPTLVVLMAGVALTVSVVAFYTALSRGPTSVVVPVFAMNFAVASVLGFVFLGESVSITRVLGIVLAGGSILLLTR